VIAKTRAGDSTLGCGFPAYSPPSIVLKRDASTSCLSLPLGATGRVVKASFLAALFLQKLFSFHKFFVSDVFPMQSIGVFSP
jgi:hypothetical protein